MRKKLTIAELFEAQKEGRQLAELYTDDPLEAMAAEAAGIDILVCLIPYVAQLRAVAPNVFIVGAIFPHDAEVCTPDAAVAAGFEAITLGADAVYTGLSLDCVRAMAQQKIPVIGHVGYVPYRSSWFGGPRAVGKTAREAAQVYQDVVDYQEAGAIGVEMEIVPARVAEEIARRTDILLISMGSGTAGACQYLFATDVLGTNKDHVPRHAKVYADLHAELERIQQMRVDAFSAFKDEVSSGAYPEAKHLLKISDEEFKTFVQTIDS